VLDQKYFKNESAIKKKHLNYAKSPKSLAPDIHAPGNHAFTLHISGFVSWPPRLFHESVFDWLPYVAL
jgi:hypothetical protein